MVVSVSAEEPSSVAIATTTSTTLIPESAAGDDIRYGDDYSEPEDPAPDCQQVGMDCEPYRTVVRMSTKVPSSVATAIATSITLTSKSAVGDEYPS